MDKFLNILEKIMNVTHKIILCVASFVCILAVTILFKAVYEKLLPGAPDWPALILIGFIGYSWAALVEYIIKKVKFE
jgi:hypothetical protein